jgi:PhoH-like ATPase
LIKTFILDTSVFIEDPEILLHLQDNIVIIPEVVLEELDHLKGKSSYKGYYAREALRALDGWIQRAKPLGESLSTGITTPNGGIIRVELNHTKQILPQSWLTDKADNRILQVCKGCMEEYQRKGKDSPVILLTQDTSLKVKADSLDLFVESIRNNRAPKYEDQYSGRIDIDVEKAVIDDLYEYGFLEPHDYGLDPTQFILNQFVIFKDTLDSKRTSVAIWNGKHLCRIEQLGNYYPSGIRPRNLVQQLIIYMLMKPAEEIPLVIIKGPAGTAKTLLSVACGLDQVKHFGGYMNESKTYRKMLICRPAINDEDIGFLPGNEHQKLEPYIRPIRDNLETIIQAKARPKEQEELKKDDVLTTEINRLFDTGIIDYQAMGFMRGRSVTSQYLVLDEFQNATASQASMIITRIGEGSKVVLIGDPQQIDHPYLNERNNGLSIAAEMMKGSPYCMQLTLTEEDSVRSKLARDAILRFKNIT